jgi:hypothetical protein
VEPAQGGLIRWNLVLVDLDLGDIQPDNSLQSLFSHVIGSLL